jgi:hypothetical protein
MTATMAGKRWQPPAVASTAPERIFLVIGEDCPPSAKFSDLDEVTWCEDRVCANDIEYVRADLAVSSAQPAAWIGPHATAWEALDELRKSVAQIIGQDPNTWPRHGNAPLAIAAVCARHALREAEPATESEGGADV